MDPIEALRIRGIGAGKKLVGDAQAGDVRAGKTFSNAQSNSNTGTLPVRSTVAQTVTPGVNNIIKQAGIYDGDITIQGDANLVAANILQGKSIFGVVGTLQTGKKYASGTAVSDANGKIIVTGLSFAPSVVLTDTPTNGATILTKMLSTKGANTSYTIGGAVSYTSSSLTASGFTVITGFSNISANWYAYE